MTWHDDAACRGMDVNTFAFNTKTSPRQVAIAVAVCARCPVATECLTEELDRMRESRYLSVGVYGGTTQAERRHLIDGTRHGPIPRRPGASVVEDRRLRRNSEARERRARVGRPDKAKEWSKRWLARLRRAAHAESWALRRELWAEQQASA